MPITRRAAGITVKNAEGKYLLQFRDGTPGINNPLTWGFFGGHFDEEETPFAAAIREFEEETGIVVTESDLSYLDSCIDQDAEIHLFALNRPVAWKDIVLKEGAGAGFFAREEIDRIPLAEWTKIMVDRCL